MFFGDLRNFFNITRITVDMCSQDSACFFGNGSFNQVWVDTKRFFINIHKYRRTTFPGDRGCRGDIRKRGGNDFPFQIQGFNCQLQSQRPICNQFNVWNAKILSQFNGKLIFKFAIIGQPAVLPYLLELGMVILKRRKKCFSYWDH